MQGGKWCSVQIGNYTVQLTEGKTIKNGKKKRENLVKKGKVNDKWIKKPSKSGRQRQERVIERKEKGIKGTSKKRENQKESVTSNERSLPRHESVLPVAADMASACNLGVNQTSDSTDDWTRISGCDYRPVLERLSHRCVLCWLSSGGGVCVCVRALLY